MIGTFGLRFGAGGRDMMAGFYAMIIIVECGGTGQILLLDGRTLAMGGQGVICARKPAVLLERSSLLWELVRATEPVPLVKVMFLLAFFA